MGVAGAGAKRCRRDFGINGFVVVRMTCNDQRRSEKQSGRDSAADCGCALDQRRDLPGVVGWRVGDDHRQADRRSGERARALMGGGGDG